MAHILTSTLNEVGNKLENKAKQIFTRKTFRNNNRKRANSSLEMTLAQTNIAKIWVKCDMCASKK